MTTYAVLIRRDQGTAQSRLHTTDRPSAVRYYQKLLPTAGFAKILVVREGEQERVVETTRYVADGEGFTAVPEKGEAWEGFDWAGTELSPSHESATEVRGDPFSMAASRDNADDQSRLYGSQRRADILRRRGTSPR